MRWVGNADDAGMDVGSAMVMDRDAQVVKVVFTILNNLVNV